MNFFIDKGEGALLSSDTLDGERFRLSLERIRLMTRESAVHPLYVPYFQAAAEWILLLLSHGRMLEDGSFESLPIDELQRKNRGLYEDILPDCYDRSWANPVHAVSVFGKETGQVLAALAFELRCMIPLVYEGEPERFLIRMELLLEIYFAFVTARDERNKGEGDGLVPASHIRSKIGRFLEDYAEEETLVRVQKSLAGGSLPESILRNYAEETDKTEKEHADKAGKVYDDPRLLYRYGAYISDNETGVYAYLAQMEEAEIKRIADTWTEGFRIGFEVTGKDLSIRKSAGLFYPVGFERIAAEAAVNLEKMGLRSVIPGQQADLFTQHLGRGGGGIGCTSPNPQYSYDHREDLALFFDDVLRGRRIQALQQAYRNLIHETVEYAGPVLMDTFGEKPFSPVMHEEAPAFSKTQQKKIARFRQEADLLYDRAVIGKERSFTIIAFPVPEITEGYPDRTLSASYDEIFRSVIRINTLDYVTYRDVQARIIEVLDTACSVRVRGRGKNRTDLTVALQTPSDPDRQTIFENCVADVNIPVGEVFTTPSLKGTEGLLHVTRVYLDGLLFEDLAIEFKDGRICSYSCGGFNDPEEGRKYIEENILFHHETLPMGECAIGTNTMACAESVRLGILERLPILIAEKTGPHFAVGDTCYSHEEQNRVFNPDGKEIFAKDNEYSLLRDTEPEKAYFGCHTDITIPYEEVGLLCAVRKGGLEVPIIREGRFVLPGTEFLNEPFDHQ